jgi:hypothetical protein
MVMMTHEPANSKDPSLLCEFIDGPRDGLKSGDLPAGLSGQRLTGMTLRLPMTQPAAFSLHAVYECQGESQRRGFWQFFFIRLEGPNGEQLVTALPESHEMLKE